MLPRILFRIGILLFLKRLALFAMGLSGNSGTDPGENRLPDSSESTDFLAQLSELHAKFGVNLTPEIEAIFTKAREEFENGNYASAQQYARLCELMESAQTTTSQDKPANFLERGIQFLNDLVSGTDKDNNP